MSSVSMVMSASPSAALQGDCKLIIPCRGLAPRLLPPPDVGVSAGLRSGIIRWEAEGSRSEVPDSPGPRTAVSSAEPAHQQGLGLQGSPRCTVGPGTGFNDMEVTRAVRVAAYTQGPGDAGRWARWGSRSRPRPRHLV